jgi:serine/threonine-protein kinase
LTEVLAAQSGVARKVAQALALELLPSERVIASAGVEDYFRGRYLWNKRDEQSLRKALLLFEQASARDPAYAPAHAGMADVYNLLGEYYFLAPNEASPKAKAAAERALRLDPGSAEAYTSLGCVRARYEWDWTGAGRKRPTGERSN